MKNPLTVPPFLTAYLDDTPRQGDDPGQPT
jgi:hypothetical protein